MKKLIISLLVLIPALVLTWAGSVSGPVSGQPPGGPVALLGIDAADGGVGGHGPISTWIGIVNNILTQVTNGGSNILVIGGGKDTTTPDDVTAFWNAHRCGHSGA